MDIDGAGGFGCGKKDSPSFVTKATDEKGFSLF
jgi:hypothetical protein